MMSYKDWMIDLLASGERLLSYAKHESTECNNSVCVCGLDDVESAFKETRKDVYRALRSSKQCEHLGTVEGWPCPDCGWYP